MDFTTWFRTWLTRHPLKTPSGLDRRQYTAEVMASIRALDPASARTPAAHPVRQWAFWPQFAMTIATAAAGIAIAVGTVSSSHRRFARNVAQEAQVLAALEGPNSEPLLGVGSEAERLSAELEMHDSLVLAEAEVSDAEWIEHTLKLLDQLNEDASADTAGDGSKDGSDEDWLKELQTLDEQDLS